MILLGQPHIIDRAALKASFDALPQVLEITIVPCIGLIRYRINKNYSSVSQSAFINLLRPSVLQLAMSALLCLVERQVIQYGSELRFRGDTCS